VAGVKLFEGDWEGGGRVIFLLQIFLLPQPARFPGEEALVSGQRRNPQEHGTIKCVYTKKDYKLVIIYHQQKEKYTIVSAYYEN